MTLPTGGAMEYDYGDGRNAGGSGFEGSASDGNPVMIYRRLRERREYPGGGAGTTYSVRTHYTVSYTSPGTVDSDITYDSSGTALAKTVHTFDGSPLDTLQMSGTSCNAWNEGLEVQTDYGSPNPLKTITNTYAVQSGCMNNPQLTVQSTTLDDTNQVSKVTFTYDSANHTNNVTDTYEYDWGNGAAGGLLRHTNTVYVTSSNYTSINLIRLPSETKVFDGANTLTSDTKYAYDEYGSGAALIVNCPGIIGHDNVNFAGGGYRGNPTTVSQALITTSSTTWLNTYTAYDIAGNVRTVTDANGHASSFSFNDNYSDGQNRSSYAYATTITNALNQQQTIKYDYGSGDVTPFSVHSAIRRS
ncbi:MAG TPA: hypothetical protein VLI55_22915 [Bryobacteraceae bacterium]|nr:hypothetical protein [Bryobacteraceae bacterium]